MLLYREREADMVGQTVSKSNFDQSFCFRFIF